MGAVMLQPSSARTPPTARAASASMAPTPTGAPQPSATATSAAGPEVRRDRFAGMLDRSAHAEPGCAWASQAVAHGRSAANGAANAGVIPSRFQRCAITGSRRPAVATGSSSR